MKISYSDAVAESLEKAPAAVKAAFVKQVKMLERDLRHPSLRAKKYDEANDRWQARVNKGGERPRGADERSSPSAGSGPALPNEPNKAERSEATPPPTPTAAAGSFGTKGPPRSSLSLVASTRQFRLSASFWEATRIALDSLRKNKLRSFLTLLGIILATTTLIAVTALIHGMDVYIAEKVSNMGSDGFRVVRMAWFGPWDPKKFFEMDKRNPQLKPDEFAFLKDKATLLKDLGMMASRNARVSYKGISQEQVNIQGITDNIPAINNVQIDMGRGITYEEVRRHAGVAFVGNDIRERFFPGVDPLGKSVSVEGNPYEVVGVAKALGSVFGQSQDNFVMIPIESYFKTYGSRNGLRLVAKAIDQEHLSEAEDESRVLMRSYRHLLPGQDDNFSIFASDTIVTLWESLTKAIAGMAVGIVSVFMVVGGIVIMNIMLAVVTERTHEIGIRKSLGARKRDILNQYMVESAVLAGTGGAIGVVIAWCVAALVRNLTSVPMALPWTSVFIGVGLSATVGLFFGIYPARQASKLDPIEALRAEK